MKNIIKTIIVVVILGIIGVIGYNYLCTPRGIETHSIEIYVEYGTLVEEKQDRNNSQILINKVITANEIIDKKISEVIDKKVKEFVNNNPERERVFDFNSGYLIINCNTSKVNDRIIGIRIDTIIKNVSDENYKKNTETYNYDLNIQMEITLSSLFKDGYGQKLQMIDFEDTKYILRKTGISFIDITNRTTTIEYKEIKEYAKSKILTAENYQLSEEEYNKLFARIIDKNKKMVAITFDDGPHKTNTNELVAFLKSRGVIATFFMQGVNIKQYPDVVKNVASNGNEIGNHTWNHPFLTRVSKDQVIKEINDTSDAIFNLTGIRPNIIRPPYGDMNDDVRSSVHDAFIMWSIDSRDWESRDPEKIVPLVLGEVTDGSIILLHDIHDTTIPAAKTIIDALINDDYQLVTVSELIEAKGLKSKIVYGIKK